MVIDVVATKIHSERDKNECTGFHSNPWSRWDVTQNYKSLSHGDARGKSQGITKARLIHPLGVMNECTNLHGNPSHSPRHSNAGCIYGQSVCLPENPSTELPVLNVSEWSKQRQENPWCTALLWPVCIWPAFVWSCIESFGLDRDGSLSLTTILSASHRWLQAWVRPANLLLRRSRGRMFQMNIWAESCYKCPTAGRLLTL